MHNKRQNPAVARKPRGKLAGVRHSLDVYYRDTARTQRMDKLNAQFITPGALAFDVGAHVGDRSASFQRLGATVLALEPQPHVFRALRLIHGRNPEVILRPWAVGAQQGALTLHINSANPTVATLAPEFIAAASDAPGWSQEVWDEGLTVPVTTLDALITEFGAPDFIKIDIEGHEADALRGLNTPIKALSFEFTTIQRACAHACIDRLSALGRYLYNISLGEDHALRHDTWLSPDAIRTELDTLPDSVNSGDVYARLV